MSIITFVLGALFGFGAKLGFDYYHNFINRQEEMVNKMATTMARWDIMAEEAAKEKTDWRKITHEGEV